LLVATAIHEDGYREIRSATVDDSEDRCGLQSCFEVLEARGLTGVKLVTSYAHKGIHAQLQQAWHPTDKAAQKQHKGIPSYIFRANIIYPGDFQP
jgi:transposase-like protein